MLYFSFTHFCENFGNQLIYALFPPRPALPRGFSPLPRPTPHIPDLQYIIEVQDRQGRGARVCRPQEEQWDRRQGGSREQAIGFSTSTTWFFINIAYFGSVKHFVFIFVFSHSHLRIKGGIPWLGFLKPSLREHLLLKKMFSFGHCSNYLTLSPTPPSPQFGQLVPLFLDVKNNVLALITEQSKDDVSDNFDHNFGTFDDFGVKNDQKG